MRRRTIVALGGGGFSTRPDEPGRDEVADRRLDDHLLSLTGVARPRVLFVPTASGDSEVYCERFLAAFPVERARASVLRLFAREVDDLTALVLDQDLVYVGGGSTANLLAIWRLHGLESALWTAYEQGVVLAGVSAGMNCWFESSITDSFGPELAGLADGLGILPGSACPHYDGEAQRRHVYRRFVAAGFPSGYAADDGAGLVFVDEELTEVVSSRTGAGGYRVELRDGQAHEQWLPTRSLARANLRLARSDP